MLLLKRNKDHKLTKLFLELAVKDKVMLESPLKDAPQGQCLIYDYEQHHSKVNGERARLEMVKVNYWQEEEGEIERER